MKMPKLVRKELEWQISEVNKAAIDKDSAKFIFEQAEKQLKQSIEISTTIVTRTTILLSVTVGILSSILAYAFKRLFETNVHDILFQTSALTSLYLLILVAYIVINIKGVPYKDLGSIPKALLHDHFFSSNLTAENRITYYYISEAENYQERIDTNILINTIRWRKFHQAIYAIYFLPIFSIIVYLISYSIHSHLSHVFEC